MFHLNIWNFKKVEVADSPTHIQIEPTVRCNLDCVTCSRSSVISKYKRMDLSLEEIDKIISLFSRLKSVKLQGLGEPFFHPQIIEMLKKFKQKDIKVWTISNGTLFLQEKYRKIVLDYVSDIAVSFDSVDKENFNTLRRGANMDKIIEGIKLLVEERNKGNSDVIIGINFVISHKNYLELNQLADLAIYMNLDYVTVADVENWMIPGELGYESSFSFVSESRKCAKEIDAAVKKLRIKLLMRGILLGYKNREKKLGNCHWPFSSLFLTVEGFVTPCCMRMHHSPAFGNLFEKNSLGEIWNSPEYQLFRRCHIEKDKTNMMCANCPD